VFVDLIVAWRASLRLRVVELGRLGAFGYAAGDNRPYLWALSSSAVEVSSLGGPVGTLCANCVKKRGTWAGEACAHRLDRCGLDQEVRSPMHADWLAVAIIVRLKARWRNEGYLQTQTREHMAGFGDPKDRARRRRRGYEKMVLKTNLENTDKAQCGDFRMVHAI